MGNRPSGEVQDKQVKNNPPTRNQAPTEVQDKVENEPRETNLFDKADRTEMRVAVNNPLEKVKTQPETENIENQEIHNIVDTHSPQQICKVSQLRDWSGQMAQLKPHSTLKNPKS